MHHVFISYSRHDRPFVERLSQSLVDHGRNTWVDWRDIPPTATFMDEIRRAIEAADSFLFVISPESCKSVVCRQELAHAAKNNKRLIPIVCTKTPDPDLPPEVAPINWIIFDSAVFDDAVASLTSAIAADLSWVRAHTELLVRATEWDQLKRSRSGLLRGQELAAAEQRLIEAASGKQPSPTQLQQQFVTASRQNATRTLRTIVAGVSTALVVTAALAVLAFSLSRLADARRRQADEQRGIAEQQKGLADEQRGIAVKNGEEAKTQAALAKQEATRANASATEATKQATRANHEADRANAAAAEAIAQRDRAESEKNRAEDAARVMAAGTLADTDPTSAALILLELHDPGRDLNALAALSHLAEQPIASAILRGHGGRVQSAAFSPDGRRVVSGGGDGTARIWAADGRGIPVILRGHDGEVTFARFSPDGRKILTLSSDRTARVWSSDGGPALAVLRGHTGSIISARFSDDGRQVTTWSLDSTVRVWSADGGEGRIVITIPDGIIASVSANERPLRVVSISSADNTIARVRTVGETDRAVDLRGHAQRIWGAAFSPDGTRVATASEGDFAVRVWRTDGQGEPLVLRDAGGPTRVEFSPDGARILSSGFSNTMQIFSATGQGAPVTLRGQFVGSAHFSPDGTHVVSNSDDRTARVWPADGSGPAVVLRGHDGPVYSAAFSLDGSRVVTTASDGIVRVWQADGGGEPFVARGHTNGISDVAFDLRSTRIVTASRDMTVRVSSLDGRTPPIVLKGHTNAVESAAFSPDGTQVLTRTADGVAWIWRADGAASPIALEGHTGPINRAMFTSDGRRVIAVSAKTLHIWSASAGQKIRDVSAPDPWVGVSPDGSRAVTMSDNHYRLWTLGEPGGVVDLQGADRVMRSQTGHRDIMFSVADGRVIMTGDGVGIWSVNGGAPMAIRSQPTGILSVALSPDGKRLAVGSNDRTAHIVPADGSNAPDIVLRGHTDTVQYVDFSPNGQWVLTASDDGTVRIWNADGHGQPVMFRTAQSRIVYAAFSPDGTRIVTRTLTDRPDGVRVWRAQPGALLAFLRGSTTACLAPDVRSRALREDERTATATFDACERATRSADAVRLLPLSGLVR